MRHLQEIYAKFKDKGLVILGLNTVDDKQVALELLRADGVTFPNIVDTSETATKVAMKDYRESACPTNYMADAEGKIVAGWCGYDEGVPQAMAALMKTPGEVGEAVRRQCDARAAEAAAP